MNCKPDVETVVSRRAARACGVLAAVAALAAGGIAHAADYTIDVASNTAGAQGTEANGTHEVDAGYTFTAPAAGVTVGGLVYEPVGYKVEIYDSAKQTWDVTAESAGASVAVDDIGAAGTRARITWNWRLKDGVKKLDADDYIQGGLVYHLDGIRNAGLAADHATNSSGWKDLVSGVDASRQTWGTAHPEKWTDKGYDFDGNCWFLSNNSISLNHQAVFQIVADYNEGIQTKKWPHLFTRYQNGDGFNTYVYMNGNDYGNCGNRIWFNASNITGKGAEVQPWDGRFLNCLLDYDKISASQTEKALWGDPGSAHSVIGTHRWAVGAGQTGGNRDPRALIGIVHAFRIYDRVLTETEIKHNMEIDHCRFYAGAGHSTGTDLVEVVSEVPAIKPADAGCWLVRGTASKTFTAEETVTVGTVTYACAGYRTETWNAAKRMWENPVVTADARSVAVSGTDGAANRRITWLWTIQSGLRTAADYTTADYVQQGLVANYDGICNIRAEGNGVTHTGQSLFWRDLSYRDVAMESKVKDRNQQRNHWAANARTFNAGESNAMETQEEIELGNENTVQAVLTGATSGQSKDFPTFFSVGYPYSGQGSDYGFFTRKYGGTNYGRLEAKYSLWVISGNPTLANWGGQYITQVMTPSAVSLFQGTAIENTFVRDRDVGFPLTQVAIGGPSTKSTYIGNDVSSRSMNGTYNAFRLYNRALTEAELFQNRKVDEIRYRGNFTDYRNIEITCDLPAGVDVAPISVAAGEYEVDGEWTFTAESIEINGVTFAPRHSVETWDGSAWSEPVRAAGGSYTYTAGAPVRLTWYWGDVSSPIYVRWTGGGDTGNLLDPLNWNGYNADGDSLGNVVPQSYSTVVVDGTTTFSIPEGTTAFPWFGVRFDTPIALGADCDWSALGTVALPSGTTIDTAGHVLKTAGIAAESGTATVTSLAEGETGTLEIYVKEGDTFTNSSIAIAGNMHLRKTGKGVFVSNKAQTYTGNTYVLEGTARPPDNSGDNDSHTGDGFQCFGVATFDEAAKLYVSKIIVSEGAVFDIRGEYAWRSKTVLAGGTFANTCKDMTHTTWGGSGVGALTADSSLDISCTTVFGDSNGKGDTNLGGYTLNATIAAGKALHLRSSRITNGVFAVSGEGTLGNAVTATDMSNATLELGCAINMGQPLTVKNYTSLYNGNSAYNYNSAKMSVTGTFKPVTDKFYGCQMQDGSTIDLNARTGAWDTTSAFTSGSKTVSFAGGATVTIDLSQRADRKAIAVSDNQYVVTWAASAKPADSVTFVPDEDTASYGWTFERDDNGIKLKPKPGFMIRISENKNIDVPGEWLFSNCPAFGTVQETALQEWMEAAGANGIPRWKSYCIGLDPADARSVVVCKADETQPAEGGFAITANLDVPSGSGATVVAYLDRSGDGASWSQVGDGRPVQSGTVTFASALGENETLAFFRVRVAVQ